MFLSHTGEGPTEQKPLTQIVEKLERTGVVNNEIGFVDKALTEFE